MRAVRLRWVVVSAILVLMAALAETLYLRLHIRPLGSPQPMLATVQSASDPKCDPGDPLIARVVLLRPISDSSGVKINSEVAQPNELGTRLTDIYKTRAERTVYVVENDDHDAKAAALAKAVAQIDVIDRVCMVNLKHLPAWYPPPFCCPQVSKKIRTTGH